MQSVGRIVLAGREVTRLAGFTARVTELQQVLKDLGAGRYTRTMLASAADLVPGSGRVVYEDHVIRFAHVPLVTPNGDVLIQDMNFEVRGAGLPLPVVIMRLVVLPTWPAAMLGRYLLHCTAHF